MAELISIVEKVENEFSDCYKHFKEFQQNPEYAAYWRQCMAALEATLKDGTKLLSHIEFCNNVLNIPPIKTFLTYYKNEFIVLTGNEKALLDVYIKKSIDAFWGFVFKVALKYEGQKSVSVSMFDYFNVKTATYFIKSNEGR